jgi:hypothetical protein
MAKRLSVALLGTGFAVTLLIPAVGVMAMLAGGVSLAIQLENDLGAAKPLP